MRYILVFLLSALAWGQVSPRDATCTVTDVGGDDAYVGSCEAGTPEIHLIATTPNTGAATLDIGAGAVSIYCGGIANCADGTIPGNGRVVVLLLKSGVWQVATGGAGGGSTLPSRTGKALYGLMVNAGETAEEWILQEPGAGLAKLRSGTKDIWSADSTVLPYLALDNAFLGDNAFAGKFSNTPSATQTLIASDAITVSTVAAKQISAASTITLVSTPTIADGDDGQHVYLINVGTNAITLRDEAAVAGTNLCLVGDADLVIPAKGVAHFLFSTTAGCWAQMSGGGTGGGGATVTSKEWNAAVCQAAAGSLALEAATAAIPGADCFIGANGVIKGFAKFMDGATVYGVQGSMILPSTFTTAAAAIKWMTLATTGNNVFQFRTGCSADDETVDVTFNAPQTVTSAAKSVARRGILSTIASVTLTGCAGNGTLFWQLYRDPGDAGDTLPATAEFLSLKLVVQ